MKKILSLSIIVLIAFNSCKDKKQISAQGNKINATNNTEVRTNTITGNLITNNNEPDIEAKTIDLQSPKFDNSDIQKFINSFAQLIKDLKIAKAEQNLEKMKLILPKLQQLTTDSKSIAEKLKNNPEDAKKFKKYMTQLEEEFQQALTK